MRYALSILACTSLLAFSGSAAFAESSVHSPLGNWELSNIESPRNLRSCQLGNEFEGGLKLGFVSEQSRIENIVITAEDGAFASISSTANLHVMPGFKASVAVQKMNENSIMIDVSKQDGLFFALQSGYLLEIEFGNTDKHVFSLTGVKSHVRKLQSCSGADWNQKKNIVSFNDFPSQTTTPPIATSQPTQINSAPEVDIKKEVEPVSSEPKPEPIRSVEPETKRIHQPGFIIAPPSEEELVKPPEFDIDKMAQQQLQQTGDPQMPEETFALAHKNDFEQEIYWDENKIKGQPKRLLSQSRTEAERLPVIIPAIEDNPKRIDLMNADKEKTYISNQELERQVKLSQTIQKPIADLTPADVVDASYTESETPTQPDTQADTAVNQAQQKPVAGQWLATAGQSVRDVLVEWSLNENVELIWDSNNQFKVLKTLNVNKSYEDAVASLLGQYMHESVEVRPVGQLYIDPNDGRKVLIVQTN